MLPVNAYHLLDHFLTHRISSCEIQEDICLSNETPIITIVIPAHNCADIIETCLCSLIDSMSLPFEMVIIIDSSTDSTYDVVKGWLNKNINSRTLHLATSIRVITSSKPLYETLSDSIGIRNSSAAYILEVQADMIFDDPRFDSRLYEIMQSDPRIAIIGGRGIVPYSYAANHSANCSLIESNLLIWFCRQVLSLRIFSALLQSLAYIKPQTSNNTKPTSIIQKDDRQGMSNKELDDQFFSTGFAGRLDESVCYLQSSNCFPTGRFPIYYGDCVMRGPLLISRGFYDEVGGLDARSFFLGYDDLELCMRFAKKNMKVCYTPVRFYSPYYAGATRKKKSLSKIVDIAVNRVIRSLQPRVSKLASELSASKLSVNRRIVHVAWPNSK